MGRASERKKVAVFDPVDRSRAMLGELLQGMGYLLELHRGPTKLARRARGSKAADLLVINLAVLGPTYKQVTAELEKLDLGGKDVAPMIGITVLSLSQEARTRLEQLGIRVVLSHSASLMELIFAINRLLFPKFRELRRYARVFGGFPLQFLHDGQWHQGQVYNISQEGAFVSCDLPPPENARLEIRLVLPGLDVSVETRAQVNWVNDPSEESFQLSPKGMGVHFLTMSAEDSTSLGRFIADRINGTDPTDESCSSSS